MEGSKSPMSRLRGQGRKPGRTSPKRKLTPHERKHQSASVRLLIARYEDAEKVCIDESFGELTVSEVWHVLQSCRKCRELSMKEYSCIGVDLNLIRCISASIGSRLEVVDLSSTSVTDEMIEKLLLSCSHLLSIKLSNCPNVTHRSIQTISSVANRSLQSLDVSRAVSMKDVGLEYLGGTIGVGRPSACMLRSLNISQCPYISNVGLTSIATGCRMLQYFCAAECIRITDEGVLNLVSGCRKLKLLNLDGCSELSDASLVGIGKKLKELKSLQLKRVLKLTDKGLEHLSGGCSQLQSLNLAGCRSISGQGLCALAQGCPRLQILNISGCDKVRHYVNLGECFMSFDVYDNGSLKEIIKGFPYVELAQTFFGFKPLSNAVQHKVAKQKKVIEDSAALVIQSVYRGYVVRKRLRRAHHLKKQFVAVVMLKLWFRRVSRRVARRMSGVTERQVRGSILIQSYVRRAQAQKLRNLKYQESITNRTAIKIATKLQAVCRGKRVRKRYIFVQEALDNMRYRRISETQNAVAVRMQAVAKRWRAKKFLMAAVKEAARRKEDQIEAATQIQARYRGIRGRRAAEQRRQEVYQARHRERLCKHYWGLLFYGACFIIQCGRHRRRYKAKVEAALFLQCRYRSAVAKRIYRVAQERLEFEHRIVTKIQKVRFLSQMDILATELKRDKVHTFICERAEMDEQVWRGKRVANWRHLKLEKLQEEAKKAEQRRLDLELQKTQEAIAKRQEEAERDSASDDEEGIAMGSVDIETRWELRHWQEHWDEHHQCSYWYNYDSGEYRYYAPPTLDYERSLVGHRLKVFWTEDGEWLEGTISKFNVKKMRHRLDYDDGSHEWIDLEKKKHDLFIFDAEAEIWLEFIHFETEELAERRRIEYLVQKERVEDTAVGAGENDNEAATEEYYDDTMPYSHDETYEDIGDTGNGFY